MFYPFQHRLTIIRSFPFYKRCLILFVKYKAIGSSSYIGAEFIYSTNINSIIESKNKKCTYITNLSSERLGRIRLTATGVPRQPAFMISPKDPYNTNWEVEPYSGFFGNVN